jgi:hypothetical protein
MWRDGTWQELGNDCRTALAMMKGRSWGHVLVIASKRLNA